MQKKRPGKILYFSADERTLWKRLQKRGIPSTFPRWAQQPAGAKKALSRFRTEIAAIVAWLESHGCEVAHLSLDGSLAKTERTLRTWALSQDLVEKDEHA